MKEIVPGVYMMERLLVANVYLLQSDNGAALIDSGTTMDADRILTQISQAGYDASNIHSIVITHMHGDHAGGAPKLSQYFDAQIMAHREDAPYISKTARVTAFASFKHLVNWLDNNLVLPHPPCKVTRLLEEGDKIDALSGCEIIDSPGHTAGSICLYQPDRQIMFCGDALFNANPVTRKPGLRLPLRLVTMDNAQALQTVRKLARLPIKVLCFGHGEPIMEDVGEKLDKLLADIKTVP
jgi:glyoxylase-like metal-dependent hydrolase (beta-lactamase superfamily II)